MAEQATGHQGEGAFVEFFCPDCAHSWRQRLPGAGCPACESPRATAR